MAQCTLWSPVATISHVHLTRSHLNRLEPVNRIECPKGTNHFTVSSQAYLFVLST